jgi:hypothetical protein
LPATPAEDDMSDRRESLSPTAVLLLGNHRPGEPAYHSWALGLPKSPNGLEPIDAAYAELMDRGLLQPSGLPVPVLPGVIRDAFILPAAGSDPAWRSADHVEDESPDAREDFLPREGPGEPASVDLPAADLPASVDLPAALANGLRPEPARPLSFAQAVRVGLGLGIGFWAAGLAGLGIVVLAMSLVGGSTPRLGPPAGGSSLAQTAGTPR